MTDARQHLIVAERHVRQIEAHIARQHEIVAEMERDHHPMTAEVARKVLDTLLQTLDTAKQHVELLKEQLARLP